MFKRPVMLGLLYSESSKYPSIYQLTHPRRNDLQQHHCQNLTSHTTVTAGKQKQAPFENIKFFPLYFMLLKMPVLV
jgi:hypothetical protein